MKFKIFAVVFFLVTASLFFIMKYNEDHKLTYSQEHAIDQDRISSGRKNSTKTKRTEDKQELKNTNLQNISLDNISEVRYNIVEGMRSGKMTYEQAVSLANQIDNKSDKIYLLAQIAMVLGQKNSYDEFRLMLEDIPPGNNRNHLMTTFCDTLNGRLDLQSALTIIELFSGTGYKEDMSIVFDAVVSSVASYKYEDIAQLMRNPIIAHNDHFREQMNAAYVNACAAQFENIQEGLKHAKANTSMDDDDLNSSYFNFVLGHGKADPYSLYDESWVSQDGRNAIIDFVARNNLRDQPEKALAWLSDNLNDVDSNGVYSSITQWVADDTQLASELIVKIESSTLKKISCMALVRELRNTGSEAEAKAWEQYLGEVVEKLPDFPTAVEVKSR
jgi:hypothetical protein